MPPTPISAPKVEEGISSDEDSDDSDMNTSISYAGDVPVPRRTVYTWATSSNPPKSSVPLNTQNMSASVEPTRDVPSTQFGWNSTPGSS